MSFPPPRDRQLPGDCPATAGHVLYGGIIGRSVVIKHQKKERTMEWLNGYKTFIVFGLVLLNGIIVNVFGWGLELPPELQEWIGPILALAALILRTITKTPIFKKK